MNNEQLTGIAFLRSKWIARPVAFLLSALMIWTPFYAAWADAISDTGMAGQKAGMEILPKSPPATADTQGNITLYPDSSKPTYIGVGEMHQGATGDFSSFTSVYGNDASMISQGGTSQSTLSTEASHEGEAYRTVVQSKLIAMPDMRNDPIWHQTDETLENLSTLKSQFADCTTSTTTTTGTISSHVPDYKTCEVVSSPAAQCTLQHHYSEDIGYSCAPGTVLAVADYARNGSDHITAKAICANRPDGKIPFTFNGYGGNGGCIPQQQVLIDVKTPTDWVYAGQVAPHWEGSCWYGIYVAYQSHGCNGNTCTVSWKYYYPGWGYDDNGNPNPDQVIDIRNTTFDLPHITWINEPVHWSGLTEQCQTALDAAAQGACTVQTSCSLMPVTDASGCTTLTNGTYVCPANMETPPIPNIDPLCQRADLNVSCSGITQGQMSCYIDINGHLQCPVNNGGNPDGCAQYRTNPNCGFISSKCLEGSGNTTGNCYVSQQTWDCGTTTEVPTTSTGSTYNCVGPIRCMGTDCMTPTSEQNHDFARAAGALQAAQAMHNDGSCSNPDDPSTCTVFAGKPAKCKRAVGGIVDCCKSPGGVSLSQYLELLYAVQKLDSAVMTTSSMEGSVLRGSWETLRAPIDAVQGTANVAWEYSKDWFSTAWESMSGTAATSTAGSVTELSASAMLDKFKNDMIKKSAEWVYKTFGESATNALYSNAAGSGVVDKSTGIAADGTTINPAITSSLGMIAMVYMYYTVALIVINLIWECEKEELELTVKRDLKLCHQVGSYCSQDTAFGCIESKESYCCYNSPLSRIIQEQIHPIDGASWGTPENPRCEGVDMITLNSIDWSRVNLDEWIGMLNVAGKFPNASNTNIDTLTGSGSFLNINGDRLNSAQRTTQRIDGTPPLDTTGVRDAATQTLR
jgi:conjugal transfer mating pair stabilization protein TraN